MSPASAASDPGPLEQIYQDNRVVNGLPAATPWDIGGPQPFIKQLVALGAIRGNVLDPGTGPGHHAIYYASQGLSATGIDISAAGLQRARANARAAGASVDFRLADATKLEGLDDRFDTVVDCAFYHFFDDDPPRQESYLQALHRATATGAQLFMFEFGGHDVNGLRSPHPLSASNFQRMLPENGWEITYLGPTTYQSNMTVASLQDLIARNPHQADELEKILTPLRLIEPVLNAGRVHIPFWEVHARRQG